MGEDVTTCDPEANGDASNVQGQQSADTVQKRDFAVPPPPVGSTGPPNGGLQAWLVVLGAWCASFCSWGWINNIGTFQEYYESGPLSQYSPSTIAWIPSLQVFFVLGMGPVVGKTFDRYGPRGLILGGTFLHIFGLMMASLSTEYYQFLLSQGVCSAIGCACLYQPALSCISMWFSTKAGIAFGVMATGTSVGGIIYPIMVSRMIKSVGYPWAMRVAAFLSLFLLIIAILTIRSRKPPGRSGLTATQMTAPFRDVGYLGILLSMLLIAFGVFIPINYLPVQAIEEVGMSPNLSQYLLAIMNAGSLFGRFLSGYLSDSIGRFNSFLIFSYCNGIFILGLWIPGRNQASTIAFAVLFGFFSGAFFSLIGALVASISPLPEIGYRTGVAFFAASIGALTTNPIAGAIFQHSGRWSDLKIFAGLIFLAGTTVMLAIRFRYTGFKLMAVF